MNHLCRYIFRFHVVTLYDICPSLTSHSIIILKSIYIPANGTKNYLKNDAYELVYKKETDSQTLKTNQWLSKGKGMGRDKLEVWD